MKVESMQELEPRGSSTVRILLAVSGFGVALALGCMAVGGFMRVLPWLKADTGHVTWIVAGLPFTGWGLLVPPAACLAAAVFTLIMSVWVLRARE